MAYPSKTYSLSDEVIAEIKRRVDEESAKSGRPSSPNQILTALLWPIKDKSDNSKRQKPLPHKA